MDNFEELNNEQLRLKLLEYGLANMPVTQTTRKVLIKKLKNHIENANSKTRRETIHITKYSSDEEVEEEPQKPQKKDNRRATIGGSAAKLSKTLPVIPKLPPPNTTNDKVDNQEKVQSKISRNVDLADSIDPSQKRRSGRVTPVSVKEDAPTKVVSKEPIIEEFSDEDNMPLSKRKDRKSKSKSPSLSRAKTVTTSYIHEVVSKAPLEEEMEIDLTESTDDIVIPEQPKLPPATPPRQSYFSSNITSNSINKRTTISNPSGLSQTRQTDIPSSYGRPSIAATYSYSGTHLSKNYEEPRIDVSESPYLSEFTKRLSRLKAETAQANTIREQPIRRTLATSYASSGLRTDEDYVQSRLTSIRGGKQAGTSRNDGDIRASLRQVIVALDQKYPIKKMFYLVIVSLIVIFLFVFFFL